MWKNGSNDVIFIGSPIWWHNLAMVVLRTCRCWRAKRPRRLRQEPQLLEVSENEAEEGRM